GHLLPQGRRAEPVARAARHRRGPVRGVRRPGTHSGGGVMDAWNFGRGDGFSIVLAAVLIVAWPVVLVGLVVGFGWYVIRPTIKAAVKHWPATIVGLVLVALALVLGPVEAAGATVGAAI